MKKLGLLFIFVLLLGCGKDADHYLEEGNAYLRRGDMAGAIGMYEKAVEADPSNYMAHNSLGAALSSIGDFERAIGHFRTAVAVNDSFLEGHYNLGRGLAEIGSYDFALTELREAIRLDSTYALAYLTAGDIYSARKMADEAADAYRRTLRFDPNLMIAYLRLASVYVGAGEHDRALEVLKEARLRRPEDAEIISMAGRVAIMKRDFGQAVMFLNQAVGLDSTQFAYRNDLATALMLGGRKDEAVEQWRRILAGNPDPELARAVRMNLSRAETDTSR